MSNLNCRDYVISESKETFRKVFEGKVGASGIGAVFYSLGNGLIVKNTVVNFEELIYTA